VLLVLRDGGTISIARSPKREIADRVIDQVLNLRLAAAATR
jgi:hypothetical protein